MKIPAEKTRSHLKSNTPQDKTCVHNRAGAPLMAWFGNRGKA